MNTASLIIAFYQRVEFLSLVLAGLERQSSQDFEVIIADDGSSVETVSRLNSRIKESPLSIRHVWHEDRGFRKNMILNSAIRSAKGEYLIFIDMDCVPHREFVSEHLRNRRARTFLTGRRVNLSARVTERLTEERVRAGYLESHVLSLITDGLLGQSLDVEKGFYVRSEVLRRLLNRKQRSILGCNFSLHRTDMLAINGFDERYQAPSIGEDTDVQYRLNLNGVTIKTLNHIAVQYHLYHKPLERPQHNLDLFELVKKEGRAYTRHGINQHV